MTRLRAPLAAVLALAPALAWADPVACVLDDSQAPDAPVLRIDCDLIGVRAAYSLDAHDGVHADVAALDAMVDAVKAQREQLRQELTAERLVCAGRLEIVSRDLRVCADAVAKASEPPSRALWFGVGAASAVVAGALVFIAAR